MKLKFFLKKFNITVFFIILFIAVYGSEGRSDEGKIGEIRYSILTLEQFQRLYGREWELMKGQRVKASSELFQLWGRERLPDARGVYLRSANHGRAITEGNPNGDVDVVGAYLTDHFKSHNHGGGNHSHDITCELSASRNHQGNVYNTMASGPHNLGKLTSSHSGNIIGAEGDKETRPRSIIVNTYIKVKERAVDTSNQVSSQIPTITPEMMNVITTRPEFRAAENAVRDMMNRRN